MPADDRINNIYDLLSIMNYPLMGAIPDDEFYEDTELDIDDMMRSRESWWVQ